jgi:hypothetical protein
MIVIKQLSSIDKRNVGKQELNLVISIVNGKNNRHLKYYFFCHSNSSSDKTQTHPIKKMIYFSTNFRIKSYGERETKLLMINMTAFPFMFKYKII